MIHITAAMVLVGISHLISFWAMTERKYSVGKTAFIYLAFFAMFLVLTLLSYTIFKNGTEYYAVGYVCTLIMSFFVFVFVSADPICKKIFLFVSYANVFSVFGCISAILCGLFLKNSPEIVVFYARNIARTIMFVPAAWVYLRFLRPAVRAVPEKRRHTWYSISVVSVLFLVIFASSLIIFHTQGTQINEYTLFFAIAILIYCSVLWVIFGTIQSMIAENNTELVRQNAVYLQEQLKAAKENELSAKTVRHDFRHHNQNVISMLGKGEVQKAIDYLEQYNDSLDALKLNDFCPNITVNAILNSFYTKAQKNGISVSVEADTNENTPISDMDFVAVLSNLLENAVNGCIECDSHGEIKLNIRTVSDKIVILCTNPCKPGIVIENNIIKNRGIGIAGMLAAIRKYNGDIKYSTDNKTLSVCIILNT